MLPVNVLFVCTHNRCRSILCEAITNHFSDNNLQAYSAGSHPEGKVYPSSLRYLSERGYSITGLKSQSWSDFSESNIDLVITVCSQAENETCPIWMGSSPKLHWGLNDSSKVAVGEQKEAFNDLINEIERKTQSLLARLNHAGTKEKFISNLNAL